MTRMLFTAGALALAVATTSSAALAGPAFGQSVQPSPAAVRVTSTPAVDWHYEWRYRYDRHGEYVPGWVAVLNNAR